MRIAILSCDDSEKWQGWTERLWTALLEKAGDTFTTFRCYQEEFPDLATSRNLYDVIVVGGSRYSAYDNLPWIRQLEKLLPQYIDSGVRVVGCCFGHQILAKALGGSVGRNPSGRFVLGVENVVVDVGAAAKCGLRLGPLPPSSPTPPPTSPLPSTSGAPEPERSSAGAANLAFPAHGGGPAAGSVTTAASTEPFGAGAGVAAADAAGGPGRPVATIEAGSHSDHLPVLRLRVLESHGDQVLELPPGASLLAASGTAAHEMWALGDRCLAFQFHPELTTDLVYDKIWTALSASGRLSPEESAAAEAQLKAGSGALDSDLFIQALNGFLRAQHPEPRYPSTSCGTRGPEARAAAEAAAAEATAAATAAAVAEAAASNSVQVAKELRQGLERRAAEAAEEVLGHVRHAAAAGMAAGTADAELLTALNQEAAVAYGRAAAAAEGASAHLAEVVASQHEPLKAALASLGALEVQLDRLAAVVGSLERESAAVEEQVELQVAREARARQQQ